MTAFITLFHVALAAGLFVLLGWIGRHSTGMGYISLSLFVTRDEAPAFNFLFRAFGPIAFIVIVSAALYGIGADAWVRGIWLVTVYYSLIRLAYNLAMDRRLLLNWVREAVIITTTTGGAWLLYDGVIQERRYLLPDAQGVTTELWIIVALFVYAVLNRVEVSYEASRRRKENYLFQAYNRLRSRYRSIVQELAPNQFVESLVFTIMVYENFQRPPAFQKLEKAAFPRFSKSLGPMQVQTDSMISDEESVGLGTEKNVRAYERSVAENAPKGFNPERDDYRRVYVVYDVAKDYNPDDNYMDSISELNKRIIERFYPEIANAERGDSYHGGLAGIASYV